MEYVQLGRTGLRVSRAGLGCGGPSRLGLSRGSSGADAERVVRKALELGVNFFDTAETYGTEGALGSALRGVPRSSVVLATKKAASDAADRPTSGAEYLRGIEESLRRLGTDHVDVYQIHALGLDEYDHALAEIVPAMQRAREQGKIRHIGVTEEFIRDPGHAMLGRALNDDVWETVMAGMNLLNPSARSRVLPAAAKCGVGTLIMFAVRRALSRPDKLAEVIEDLERRGLLEPGALPRSGALDFLVGPGRAASVVEAAYRYAAHCPGADVILTGTGSPEHLEANVRAISAPALPEELLGRLETLFGRVDCVSGN
jgi:aryl-alcohol dehydrogenase-like predicted oxidoreductase